ncbi:MAG: OmpA family protein [Dysgonamonadaceae bacterium]|jgi:outer membrane protein OmpA-like peptidoglycan-associated protein|nr:OmpA family protein [Dysgonamonadaceae bacterium]
MKTKFLLAALLLGCFFLVSAQDTQQNYPDQAGFKTPFKRNNSGDNWFLHVGAGGQVYFADFNDKADFTDRVTVAPTISVGKWFSPYWGFRLKAQGGALRGFLNDAAFMQHDKYYNLHVDAMWNLANYWGKYTPSKLFNFTPYIGLGYAHRFENDQNVPAGVPVAQDFSRYSNALSMNTGIQFGFSLSSRVNLDFDFGAAVVPDYFNRMTQKAENELIATASAGFTFKLGKSDFQVVEPMDYALINDLNSKINALRSENEQLSKRPVSCPECPKVVPTVVNEVNYVPNIVFFRLNSSKIDANQQVSVYNTAQFMKNTGEKIKVIGYADKKTGTNSYNLKLSEKRAKAVAKELTSKYNIPTENIVVEWKGSDEQPYPENNWNRVVIMSAQ